MRLAHRRIIRTAAVLGVLVAATLSATSGATAAPRPAPPPPQDSVTGTGTANFCPGIFRVDARSGPSGENPTGEVLCEGFFAGPVTCLSVTANVALLITQTSQFGGVALRITDNGPSGDRLEALPGPGCPDPLGSYLEFSFVGDLTVVDAPAGRTSRDACKGDGFVRLGFRNQGQCVASAQRGPGT